MNGKSIQNKREGNIGPMNGKTIQNKREGNIGPMNGKSKVRDSDSECISTL